MKLFQFVGGGGTYTGHADIAIALAKSIRGDVTLVINEDLELPVDQQSTQDQIVRLWHNRESESSNLNPVLLVCGPSDALSTCVDQALSLAANNLKVVVFREQKKINVYPWSSREYVTYRLS